MEIELKGSSLGLRFKDRELLGQIFLHYDDI